LRVTILGAGAMGSALTIPLTDRGNEVRLWATEYDRNVLNMLREGKVHPRINVTIPSEVALYEPEELEDALKGADVVVVAVSSEGLLNVLNRISGLVECKQRILAVTKGFVKVNGRILTVAQAVKSLLGEEVGFVYISGPSIAKELASRSYTNVIFNCEDREVALELKKAFETEYYRIGISTDVIGAELCAALKNVYAIAIGVVDGLAEAKGGITMENAKATLFSKSIGEMAEIVKNWGGEAETAYGLSGIGDLLVTIRGGRNGMLGRLIGRGLPVEGALNEMARKGFGVVEGYVTAKVGYEIIIRDRGLKPSRVPVLYNTYRLLHEGLKLEEFLKEVL